MLAPDPVTTQPEIQASYSAALPVTSNATAVKYLVKPFSAAVTDPAIRALLHDVQSDSQVWGQQLCAQYSVAAPGMFTRFGPEFQSAAAGLQQAADALGADPDNSAARRQLLDGLHALLGRMQIIAGTIAPVQAALADYSRTMQSDHAKIDSALLLLAKDIPSGATIVQQLSGVLSTGFYQTSALSPCSVMLTLDESVSMQLTQIGGSAPSLVPLAMCNALLSGLKQANEVATSSLSAVMNTWAVLETKYQSVLDALQQASADELPPLLRALDIQVASQAWGQLADFAQSLLNANTSVCNVSANLH